MGDGSLNHTALLEVINGTMYLSVSIHSMQIGNLTTALTGLQILQPNGSYLNAVPIAYNLAGGQPSAYRFQIYNVNSYLPVKVDPQVAIMGSGLLDARLLINWSSLVAVASDTVVSSNTQTYFSSFSLDEEDVEDTSTTASPTLATQPKTPVDSLQAVEDQDTPLADGSRSGFPFIWVWGSIVLAATGVTIALVSKKLSKAKKQRDIQ